MKGENKPFDIFKAMPQFAENMIREVTAGNWFDASTLFDEENWPPVDVLETADEVIVSVDLPGLKGPGDVNLELKGNSLLIQGEITREEMAGAALHKQERPGGKFSRLIIIPALVEAKNVRAQYRRGILEIRCHKEKGGQAEFLDVDFAE